MTIPNKFQFSRPNDPNDFLWNLEFIKNALANYKGTQRRLEIKIQREKAI
jgi:hypothetical protein